MTLRRGPGLLAAAALLAVVAVLVGAAFAGSLAPDLLADPGAVVRWGLPVTTVLGELVGAVSLGALVLAAVVVPLRPSENGPGRGSTSARETSPAQDAREPHGARPGAAWARTMLVAAVAAGVWTVTSVVGLVLTYAAVAGRPLDAPTFGAELGLFVTSVSLGRTLLGVTLVAAVTCTVALLATGPRGALAVAALAATALALQSQTGHAAGSAEHDLAISSMFLHLAGAAVWIGALAALALVAHRLGADLGRSVARYSAVAGWCYAAVATSGAVNGAIRLGDWDDLGSRYGILLVVKVVLFAVLGLLGLTHRRRVVPRLDVVPDRDGPARPGPGPGRAPWLFWRLVAVELAVMGAVSGVAVALGSTPPPVPQGATGDLTPAEIVTGHLLPPAPTGELWLTSFRWDLLPALGCLAAVVVYGRWVLRLRRRGDAWPVHRTLCLVAGMVLLAWTTSGGPAVYGHVLFSAHMLQHMALVMVVPILIVLSAPVTLAARALPARADGSWGPREWILGLVHSRWARLLANPVVAAVNFAGSMFVFYFTDAFELALTTYLGHLLMVAHFTLAGYLFVNALIGVDPGPRRPGYALRLVLLFATMAFHAFFGLALVSSAALLVPRWFGLLGRPWGPSALDDQHAGGAIAWGVSELPMLVLAIAVAVAWTRDDERTARRQDRAADRDGDAELTEYNAMLTRLAGRDRST